MSINQRPTFWLSSWQWHLKCSPNNGESWVHPQTREFNKRPSSIKFLPQSPSSFFGRVKMFRFLKTTTPSILSVSIEKARHIQKLFLSLGDIYCSLPTVHSRVVAAFLAVACQLFNNPKRKEKDPHIVTSLHSYWAGKGEDEGHILLKVELRYADMGRVWSNL